MTLAAERAHRAAPPAPVRGADGFASVVALATTFLMPLRVGVPVGGSVVSWGVILGVLLLPFLQGAHFNRRGFRWFQWSIVAALASGWLLTITTHNRIDQVLQFSAYSELVCLGISTAVLVWASTELRAPTLLAVYGAGALLQAAVTPASWSSNAWKFALSYPVVMIVLALVDKLRSRIIAVVAAMGVTAMSALHDYRSMVAFVWISVLVFFLNRRHRQVDLRAALRVRPSRIAILGLLLFGAYKLVVKASEAGYLGLRNQQVTIKQTDGFSSLVAGGRVENSAALALFKLRPQGYGPGVIPSQHDIAIGTQALIDRAGAAVSDYAGDFIFVDAIKLHSIGSDLWVRFGVGGVVLAVVSAVMLAAFLTRNVLSRQIGAAETFVLVVALWDVFFSPIDSNLGQLGLGIAVCLFWRGRSSPAAPMSAEQGSTPVGLSSVG